MVKYNEYNLIPLGDHCATAMALKDLNLRKNSYPFDWITIKTEITSSNIPHIINIIKEINDDTIENVTRKFIGDAFTNNLINSQTNVSFPHDTDENINNIYEKYCRRFSRLKDALDKPNVFILMSRNFFIEETKFKEIMDVLLGYNDKSIILFICGTDHHYFKDIRSDRVVFKYIPYDMSQYYNYDYTTFRPNMKQFLSEFFTQLKI